MLATDGPAGLNQIGATLMDDRQLKERALEDKLYQTLHVTPLASTWELLLAEYGKPIIFSLLQNSQKLTSAKQQAVQGSISALLDQLSIDEAFSLLYGMEDSSDHDWYVNWERELQTCFAAHIKYLFKTSVPKAEQLQHLYRFAAATEGNDWIKLSLVLITAHHVKWSENAARVAEVAFSPTRRLYPSDDIFAAVRALVELDGYQPPAS